MQAACSCDAVLTRDVDRALTPGHEGAFCWLAGRGREIAPMPAMEIRMKSEDAICAKGRPFTGAEFLESLRDGREVYIYGERVPDVTTHPAFRNAARSVARLYDALHDPRTKDVLTWPTDTGSGGYTHKFFRAARSREELAAQRDAIAQWARMSYGWMRSEERRVGKECRA